MTPTAYFVDERKEMKAYVKTFEDRDDVAAAIQQAVTDAGEREGQLAVATIAVGCDVPPGVSIIEAEDGPEVRPTRSSTRSRSASRRPPASRWSRSP